MQIKKLFRKRLFIPILIMIVIVIGIVAYLVPKQKEERRITVKSEILEQTTLNQKFTCDGENVSPAFELGNPPPGTKTYGIVIRERTNLLKSEKQPELNFLTWNIPVETTRILEGIRPPGTIARNSQGNFSYGGPCPEKGQTKEYILTIYAFDAELGQINSTASYDDFISATKGHVISSTSKSLVYTRKP